MATTGELRRRLLQIVLLLAVAWPGLAAAQQDDADQDALTSLSLQELLNTEVFSVSKSARKLSDSAAAVYVITSEEIRRSGATSIPELLRTVPGLHVARIDANKWAISARGFNGRFANKLLVLIDGRSVYTPLFSGVFWELQDTLLDDIDRIEVIRGPGATLWGANAVNGIINIITKSAAHTQGALASLSVGAVEGNNAAFRYGGAIGLDTHWRVWAKAFDRDASVALTGEEANDDWDMARAGFRLDSAPDAASSLTFEGGIYTGEAGSTYDIDIPRPPFERTFPVQTVIRGGHLLTEYRRDMGDTGALDLRLYYDRTDRRDPLFTEKRDTFDVDAQHEISLGRIHHVVWGMGYRVSDDEIGNSFTVSLDPDERRTELFNAFVQDDISLASDRVRLTLGTKLEHNDYTGWEIQPNVRVLWRIDPTQTLWAAVSRAVRTPSRIERDGRIVTSILPPGTPGNPAPFPVAALIWGDSGFGSEKLVAYELGYRVQTGATVSVDVAAFYNDYDDLRDGRVDPPFPGNGFVIVPLVLTNNAEARTWGAELALEWQPEVWARVRGGYGYLDTEFDDPGLTGSNPQHQGFVWASLEPMSRLELDMRLRYASRLPLEDVPAYLTADARVGWRLDNGLDLALVGQHLLHDERVEFVSELTLLGLPARIERSVYLAATWQF